MSAFDIAENIHSANLHKYLLSSPAETGGIRTA